MKCSFCGKRGSDAETIVGGPTPAVAICNECVDLCREIMDEEAAQRRARKRRPMRDAAAAALMTGAVTASP